MTLTTMFTRLAVLLLTGALSACASYDGRGLVAGKSTAADVEQVMGQPAEKIAGAAGDTVWFYPRNPFGRHTYAVSVAPDGRVRGIEQTLTMENMARIAADSSTAKDVRLMFGPPYRITRNHMRDRDVWEYRMFNQIQIPYNLFVQYSLDGVVREVLFLRDPSQDMPAPRS
jgi:hypothetical protein